LLEELFKNPVMLSDTLAEIPIVGGLYIVSQDHCILLPVVCAALCAKAQFSRDAPAWAPCLPLRREDCEKLENDDSNRLNLVGYYGCSLRETSWDYQTHPPFAGFASGLMAYKHTPDHLRNDPELQREFPPTRLKGLCGGHLHWRSPAMIAWDRAYQARCAAYEAAVAQERMG
jgi:hypothetical protein